MIFASADLALRRSRLLPWVSIRPPLLFCGAMLLLWILWRKGYVVQSVRQPGVEDDAHPAPAEAPAG